MASEIVSTIKTQLQPVKVLLPGDEGFDESRERWSKTCVLPAAAVICPKTTAEVSAAVKFTTENGLSFNVRGGGHSSSKASSAPSPEGVVLDLSLMRNVSVNKEAMTTTFDGGCRWADVDKTLWEHGLATPGGTVSHTGVGGLILHGGFGILTGIHGLTIDCLISCEVVLADGRIVIASEKENADLFWALRGAGSSFGVVTSFTSRVFHQGNVYGGALMFLYNTETLDKLINFLNHWAETTDGSQGMGLGFMRAPPSPENPTGPRPLVVLVQIIHVGVNAAEDGPEYFATLLDIEGALMNQVGSMPYPKFNSLSDEGVFPWGKRYQFGGSNFTAPLNLSGVESVAEKFYAFIQSHADKGLDSSLMVFEGIPNGKVRSVPANSMAFNSRGDYFNVGICWAWNDPSLDEEVRVYNRKLQQDIRSLGYNDETLSDGVGAYINYMHTSVTAKAAFGSNTERLIELKEKYDPGNVFDKAWKLKKDSAAQGNNQLAACSLYGSQECTR